MSEISLKKMSFEELSALEVAIRAEKDSRESERFMELVVKACDALNTIKDEFPWAEMRVEMHCSECGMSDDFNLFDLVDRFSTARFSRR